MPPVSERPIADGGCACGAVRFRLLDEPMFVHCCHCTRCQRETGGPFAHHAMIEFSRFQLLGGEPEYVQVPTDSGGRHWVARCPTCRTAMWNEHGSRQAITKYVRVGTLDEPDRFPPRAHIFVRSRQAWFDLPPGQPAFAAYYDAAKAWPAASLERYARAREVHQAQRRAPAARGTRTSQAAETGGQRSTARGASKTGSPTQRSK